MVLDVPPHIADAVLAWFTTSFKACSFLEAQLVGPHRLKMLEVLFKLDFVKGVKDAQRAIIVSDTRIDGQLDLVDVTLKCAQ